MRRELQEELGIEVAVGECWERVTHAYAEQTIRLAFYLCRWLRHEPKPLGCAGVAWVKRRELPRYEFPPADSRLLARLMCTRELWD